MIRKWIDKLLGRPQYYIYGTLESSTYLWRERKDGTMELSGNKMGNWTCHDNTNKRKDYALTPITYKQAKSKWPLAL